MLITDQHKKYLSSILTDDSEDAVMAATLKACYVWGLNPDTPDPTENEWSESEQNAMSILSALREGLADGTVTPSATKPVEYTITESDKDDVALLEAFGKLT